MYVNQNSSRVDDSTLRLIKDVHWSMTCTIFGSIGFIESFIIVLFFKTLCLPESSMERFYLVLIGVLSFFSQTAIVVSAQFETAATVALLIKGFDVMFAFIFQIIFFWQIPGYFSIFGALLISLAVISSAIKRLFEDSKEVHWLKSYNVFVYLYQ